jgi:hypothetical protein
MLGSPIESKEPNKTAPLAAVDFQPLPALPDLAPDQTFTVSSQQLATLLHELRNPLSTLQTLAKLLQKRLAPTDPNYWIGNSLEQECRQVQSLLAQFEQSLTTRQPVLQPLEILGFLTSLQPTYEAVATAHGLTFHFWFTPGLSYPAVQTDPQGLRQVLSNLIDNACKYTPEPGEVHLHLEWDLEQDPQFLTLAVTDTGVGIDPENLSRIFDPYYRASTDQPGQGLGLAISRTLVEHMGGMLQVRSTPNQGSTFTVRLPLAVNASGDQRL